MVPTLTLQLVSFTTKSPRDKVSQEIPVRKKLFQKIEKVSTVDPIIEEARGAVNQNLCLRSLSNMFTSKFCAIKKANPEPIAILMDIMSLKFVEINNVSSTPITNPI